jgi:hypothetical protein
VSELSRAQLFVLICAAGAFGQAQVSSGDITGSVIDPPARELKARRSPQLSPPAASHGARNRTSRAITGLFFSHRANTASESKRRASL